MIIIVFVVFVCVRRVHHSARPLSLLLDLRQYSHCYPQIHLDTVIVVCLPLGLSSDTQRDETHSLTLAIAFASCSSPRYLFHPHVQHIFALNATACVCVCLWVCAMHYDAKERPFSSLTLSLLPSASLPLEQLEMRSSISPHRICCLVNDPENNGRLCRRAKPRLIYLNFFAL